MAGAIMPGFDPGRATLQSGDEHFVVVAPGVGVTRVAKATGTVQLMARRAALLHELSRAGLPFAVPEPLSEVTVHDGHAAVAISWVPGDPHPTGEGEAAVLRGVLDALRAIDLQPLEDLLAPPHAYAGGERYPELMAEAVACLPADVRDDGHRHLQEALALPDVAPSLVHGDLGGHNMRWTNGRVLSGVIDWDWASAWDPAVDAACLAWHGWPAVRAAVDPETYQRARVWWPTFAIEHIVAGWLRPSGTTGPDHATGVVERAAEWLRRARDTR